MSDRETFVREYEEKFIANWKHDLGLYVGGSYEDKPHSNVRLLARATAETIWDTRALLYDAMNRPTFAVCGACIDPAHCTETSVCVRGITTPK